MRRPCMWICLLVSMMCVLWALWQNARKQEPPDVPIQVTGIVNEITVYHQKEILYLSRVSGNGESAEFFKQINLIGVICYTTQNVGVEVGETVTVTGVLTTLEGESNPGGFASDSYYLSKGYSHRMYNAKILSRTGEGSLLAKRLRQVSEYVESILAGYLTPADFGVMKGMLLGDKNDMEEGRKQLFQGIGIYHILSISGLHITFLGNLFNALLKRLRLPPVFSFFCTIILLSLYAVMTGLSVSAVRAVIMFSVSGGAGLIFRSYDMQTAMGIAFLLTILMQPYVVLNSGFLLSYLAVFAIAMLYPVMPGVDVKKSRGIDALWLSLSVWLMTLPVVTSMYYQISIYSVIGNQFIMPTVSYLMLLGILIVVFHPVFPFGSILCAKGCHIILHYMDVVVQFLDKLPGGNIVVGEPDYRKCIMYYVCIFLLCILGKKFNRDHYLRSLVLEYKRLEDGSDSDPTDLMKEKRRYTRHASYRLATLFILVIFLLWPADRQRECITFLDVGQGDGICMELQEGVFLVDCGSTSVTEVGDSVLFPFLKSRRITEIEGWFFTHADKDHISAFSELASYEGLKIHKIYIPGVLYEEFAQIREIAAKNRIEVCVLFAGNVVKLNEWNIEVLSPKSEVDYEDGNEASLVLAVSKESFDMVLMGDGGEAAEKAVMQTVHGSVTVLKVAHHGSARGSNSENFLEALSPEVSVISCGENNVYGHPHRETLERLAACESHVYRTDLQGAVTIILEEDSIRVQCCH